MGGATSNGGDSSSEEEDPNWKAAIEAIAATTTFGGNKVFSTAVSSVNGSTSHSSLFTQEDNDDGDHNHNPHKLKHYQIKAQKLLDDILEKTLVMVRDPIHVPDNNPIGNEGGVRLFKNSPVGIIFDRIDEIKGPRKRPRILPRLDVDEKSNKFKQQIQSVAVEGVDIIAAARNAGQKSLARLEAKEAAAKAKAKTDEERVAELKRVRGERWLPSIARECR